MFLVKSFTTGILYLFFFFCHKNSTPYVLILNPFLTAYIKTTPIWGEKQNKKERKNKNDNSINSGFNLISFSPRIMKITSLRKFIYLIQSFYSTNSLASFRHFSIKTAKALSFFLFFFLSFIWQRQQNKLISIKKSISENGATQILFDCLFSCHIYLYLYIFCVFLFSFYFFIFKSVERLKIYSI